MVRHFADRFLGEDCPGKRRPEVFYDLRFLEVAGLTGVLHAKAVVSDDESGFIGQTNLTAAEH